MIFWRKEFPSLVGKRTRLIEFHMGILLVNLMAFTLELVACVVGRTHRSNDEAGLGICGLVPNNPYNHMENNSHHFAGSLLHNLLGNTDGVELLNRLRRCDSCENQYGFLKVKVKVRNNMLNVNEQTTTTFPVVLHVYKVPCGTMWRLFGSELSFYRSSVEDTDAEILVHWEGFSVEERYYLHPCRIVAGIAMTTPRRMAGEKGLEFKKSIAMGRTEKHSAAELNKVIEKVGRAGGYGVYPRNVYNYISKNCHHFSDDLCYALVRKRIPGWIKRAAFYQRNYTGEALTAREKQGRKDPRKWEGREHVYELGSSEGLLACAHAESHEYK